MLYDDCRSLAGEVIYTYKAHEKILYDQFLYASVSNRQYSFQGKAYGKSYPAYIELVGKIETQPGISEELKKAINDYKRFKPGRGIGLMLEGIGWISATAGTVGLLVLGLIADAAETGSTQGLDSDIGIGLLITGGLSIGGVLIFFLGRRRERSSSLFSQGQIPGRSGHHYTAPGSTYRFLHCLYRL